MKPFFKKADIILAVVLLIIGATGLLAFRPAEEAGSTAVISLDGEVKDRLPLDTDQSVVIESSYGSNRITVENGSVFISETDCRGQDCVRMGRISREGQMIVCLPHHLTVTIEGSGNAPDAVIK